MPYDTAQSPTNCHHCADKIVNTRTRILCKDGFEMSVQAAASVYCAPRFTNATAYTSVEVGFPTEEEPLLMAYAESPHNPTGTVYGWVPSHLILDVIAKHGGMIDGQLPPLSVTQGERQFRTTPAPQDIEEAETLDSSPPPTYTGDGVNKGVRAAFGRVGSVLSGNEGGIPDEDLFDKL